MNAIFRTAIRMFYSVCSGDFLRSSSNFKPGTSPTSCTSPTPCGHFSSCFSQFLFHPILSPPSPGGGGVLYLRACACVGQVDSMDTLWLAGEKKSFDRCVEWVDQSLDVEQDKVGRAPFGAYCGRLRETLYCPPSDGAGVCAGE